MSRRDLILSALAKLTEEERVQILSIINKDEIVRVQHQLHIMRLRAELQVCRRRGAATAAVGGGGGGGGGRQCGRCRAELGRVINRGACCRWCRHRVCKSCRHYGRDASDWLCTVCHKQMEVTAASGDWMGQFVRRPSKRRIAAETVKRTLQRSWTFTESSVSPWSALRGSPEMRAYSSMPRHQDWEDTPPHALPFRRPPPPPPQQSLDDQMEQNERPEAEAADTVPDDSDTKAGYESSIDSPLVGKRLTSESASSECEPSAPSPPPPPLSAAPSVADVCVDELFRRVTLKKRRLDARDLPPGVTPPRARRTAPRPARPLPRTDDPDDYRLVFISSSDSSSREELCSDDSTGDWDYYTPGGGGAVDLGQYQRYGVLPIPFPVPIPVPILVPVPWSPTVHLWSMQQLVTVQLGEGIVCGTVEKRRDDEDKCEETTEDKCGADTAVTGDEVNNELNETIRNDSVAKKESAGSVDSVDKGDAEQEASVDVKSDVPLQTSCGENSEEVIKDVCNIDIVDEEAEKGNVTAAIDAVNGEAELGLGPCDASQVNCVDSLKDDEIVEETDGVVLKTHRPLEEVRYTAKEPCDSMESDSDSSSDEEAEKNKRFYKLNEEEGSEESDGDESGEFSMASSRSSSSEGRFKRVYVVNDSDSDLGELPDQGEDEGEEEGEVTLLSHVNMEVDSLDLPEAQQREVDEEKDQEGGCEKDASAETAEFISKEVENCNRAGGELVKEVEGDRSSNSDEFSGTESMELEHQGQSQSARYTSLVMITQQDLEQPVSVVSVPETRREEDEVEVDEKRFTLTLDTSQEFLVAAEGEGEVRVVTGNGTTAVVILEEGLPDDDSWVEDLDRDDIATTTEESSEDDATFADREEELRGYNPRSAIDFTLHTIVEESCEESEAEGERRERLRPTEMERYFMFGVAEGDFRETDTMSETSSMHSEDPESLGGFEGETEGRGKDPAELASSRLEKYFLSGLLGYGRRDSDGSVGSDSEGRPSPEQRRKRLVRARGTGRLHSNSLDNLNESEQQEDVQPESEGWSTETDSHDDLSSLFERGDGQFDTVKRTKKKKRSVASAPSLELLDMPEEPTGSGGREEESGEDGDKTPQPEYPMTDRNKQQSRDSGFMGSCDDLLKEKEAGDVQAEAEAQEKAPEAEEEEDKVVTSRQMRISPQAPGLIRKDSFNNWSSDEETNLMMSKMRQFFKTMVANQSKSSPSAKPPQLVHFESELTRLMMTVPGIRDEQVKEIVEYLSSEDTWSDSYDSSDYTSSDLEGAGKKSALQEEISASCRQIISNFETVEDASGSVKDTAFVYQRLVASFSKLEAPSSDSSASHNSPPLIAKVMQHIGSRLVALMHEVSSADGGSPKASRYHRRLQPKLSTTSTTEDEEEPEDYGLPRSKSHDPLIEENRQEASDNERFSWRGSFESALMASDSRTRLASGGETSSSASALALAAKRRSAGDLLFKTSSREQLDRVRSCGSIGGSVEDKIWGPLRHKRRRSSVPDSGSGGSNDGDDDSDSTGGRSTTLPRGSSLLQGPSSTTNSLPRLPTTPAASPAMFKAHSVHQVGVVSARYRPPGFGHRGVVPPPPRRDNRRHHRHQQTSSPSPCLSASAVSDDASVCSESVSLRATDDEDRLTMPKSSLGARSDSMASVYSGAGEGRYGTVTVRGEVEFGVQYNYKQSALEIYVKQCRDLAAVDAKRNRSDPYVKVYLLPDKSKSGKRKTKVKKHTLNPVFEETLKFQTSLECVASRTLWLSVWHSDMFGRNDFLGEVTVPLADKVFDDPLPKSYPLQERSEPLEEPLGSRGELIVGLKFVPPEAAGGGKKATKGCLHVLVKEAKNLAAVKSNGTSDPFCKSYLLPDKGRSSKQKTGVQRRSVSPVWNHTFTYGSVTLADLAARSLELTVWDHDRLASNEFLGGVRLNLGAGKHNGKPVDWMDARNKETTLWQRMLERPNLWVESCLPLRASLGQPRDN